MQREVDRVLEVATDAHDTLRAPGQRLRRAAKAYEDSQRYAARAELPLEGLRDRIAGRVQWSALSSAGVHTLADLDGTSAARLQSIHGVGPATASRVLQAARSAEAEIAGQPIRLPGPTLSEPAASTLAAAALDELATRALLGDSPSRLETRHRELAAERRSVSDRITFLGWVFKAGSGDENSELMREARAVVHAARQYMDGDHVRAFRQAEKRLKQQHAANHSGQTLHSEYSKHGDAALRLITQSLGDTPVVGPGVVTTRTLTAPPLRRVHPVAHPPIPPRRPHRRSPAPPPPPLATPNLQAETAQPSRESEADESAWVPASSPVTVAGLEIPGGMVYVGNHLPNSGLGEAPDPALINPGLPVAKRAPDRDGKLMSYWPSYSDIPPESRAAYLQWLADGRQDPDAYIGYVFLFFYGLERRVLRNLQNGRVSPDETGLILQEVERLLTVYQHSRSFLGYGRNFCELLRLSSAQPAALRSPPQQYEQTWELPLSLKRGLGELVRRALPIPSEWALAWALQHPKTRLRTPARRCVEEFERLFALKYRERFGSGMQLKPPRRSLSVVYHPASSAFQGEQPRIRTEIPDVTALRKPIQDLHNLLEECTVALDPYSRWIGRNPEGKGDLHGLTLLPRQLVLQSDDERIDRLSRRLEGAIGLSELGVVDVTELFQDWTAEGSPSISKRESVQRIHILGALGFGIEPDVRFGGPSLDAEGRAVVFPLSDDAPEAPSEEYAGCTLLLHLAAAVAASDGEVSEEEEAHLERHVGDAVSLGAAERLRLRAYTRWSLLEPPSLRGMTKRIGRLGSEQRALVGRFLVAVACADGRIEPDEVKLLTKVYRLLDLDPDEVHREIHQVTTGHRGSEPVTVRAARLGQPGFSIPGGPIQASDQRGVQLDMELVRLRMAETAAVSSLLGSIFEEQAPLPEVLAESCGSLDAPHAGLLRSLIGERRWSRGAFDELAERFGLLPEGALDVLNEAALDAVDEIVCDGEDPIRVDPTIAEAVLA